MSTRSQHGIPKSARPAFAPIAVSDAFHPDVLRRFRENVRLVDWGCLEWQGGQSGYGKVLVGGRPTQAHRVAWILAHYAPIPDGLAIDHKCCNKRCVNPDHLEAVTPAENSRRVHKPAAGWQTVPQPHCEVLQRVDGRRFYAVEWTDTKKHLEFFDDPDDAHHFMRFITIHKGEPLSVVPRDIHERLLTAFTEDGVLRWLNNPHRDLGGKKPIDLLKTGHVQRVREVTAWMDEFRVVR